MNPAVTPAIREKLGKQLADRRVRLESAIADLGRPEDLLRLLTEVDSALSRLGGDRYGICDVCNLRLLESELESNPLASYCLCELTPERQRALERDLDLAWHVQAGLLPALGLSAAGWRTHYRYLPHGPVSGDYCDLVTSLQNSKMDLYFMVGDVSGKGVAASLLMAHLNAALRGFAHAGLSPAEALVEADRLLAESSLDSHYATLVCGRANQSGQVELVNAGHCAPLVVRANGTVEVVETAGLPLGLAVHSARTPGYRAEAVILRDDDSLVIYTDGLAEAVNIHDEEYGKQRLTKTLARCARQSPRDLIANCLADLSSFLGGNALNDDLTILALARG